MSVLQATTKPKSQRVRHSPHPTSQDGMSGGQDTFDSSHASVGAFYAAGPVFSLAFPVQAKLTMSHPNDLYEREADRVADQVMRMRAPQALAVGSTMRPGHPATIQRLCSECEEALQRQPMEAEEETRRTKSLASHITPFVQRQFELKEQTKSLGAQSIVAPDLQHRITALQGSGELLPQTEQAFFEPRFGVDLSQVRMHANQSGSEAAHAVSAHAFTVGQHIVFGARQYRPGTSVH